MASYIALGASPAGGGGRLGRRRHWMTLVGRRENQIGSKIRVKKRRVSLRFSTSAGSLQEPVHRARSHPSPSSGLADVTRCGLLHSIRRNRGVYKYCEAVHLLLVCTCTSGVKRSVDGGAQSERMIDLDSGMHKQGACMHRRGGGCDRHASRQTCRPSRASETSSSDVWITAAEPR